jgi:hypothetical protein
VHGACTLHLRLCGCQDGSDSSRSICFKTSVYCQSVPHPVGPRLLFCVLHHAHSLPCWTRNIYPWAHLFDISFFVTWCTLFTCHFYLLAHICLFWAVPFLSKGCCPSPLASSFLVDASRLSKTSLVESQCFVPSVFTSFLFSSTFTFSPWVFSFGLPIIAIHFLGAPTRLISRDMVYAVYLLFVYSAHLTPPRLGAGESMHLVCFWPWIISGVIYYYCTEI